MGGPGSRPVGRNDLSPREREVAGLIAEGLTNKEIARRLTISVRTAESHVQHIMDKLNVTTRSQIAVWVVQQPPQPPLAGPYPGPAPAARGPARPRRLLIGAALIVIAAAMTEAAWLARPGQARTAASAGRSVFDARLDGTPSDFFGPYSLGPRGSAEIRYLTGAVDFVVASAGGNTGTNLGMERLARYSAEVGLSAPAGGASTFWIMVFTGEGGAGAHVLEFRGADETMHLAYLHPDQVTLDDISRSVTVPGLRAGRAHLVTARVDPPRYTVLLDGKQVLDVSHEPGPAIGRVAFSNAGSPGVFRLTRVRISRL